MPSIALTSLEIRNFRGIEKLDLDFRGPDGEPNQLVVLAGPNGSGKTAVLEAALIAVGGQKLAVGPCNKKAIRKSAEDFTIQSLIVVDGNLFQDGPVEITSNSKLPEPDRNLPFWYFSSWREPILVGSVNVTVGKPGRRPAKTDPNRLLNVKQQLANAAAAQSFAVGPQRLLRKYETWVNKINDGWKTFYPEHADRFEVGLVESEDEGDGAFEVFYVRKGFLRLSVDNLSAGQLELFLFLAALVINNDREGIVFIDEPELHLDPQWHAPILRTLMQLQPKAQFIVATHSPQIFEAAMSYERHFLVPDDDPRAWAWPRVKTSAEA